MQLGCRFVGLYGTLLISDDFYWRFAARFVKKFETLNTRERCLKMTSHRGMLERLLYARLRR